MDPKLEKLKELMKLLDESLTRKEFETSFKQVLDFVKSHKENTAIELKAISESVKTAISRIETLASDNHAKTTESIAREAENRLNEVQFQCEAMMSEAQKKLDEVESGEDGEDGKDGKDGKTPTKEELLALIKPLIPKVKDGKDGKDGRTPIFSPSRGIQLKVNGVKQGMVSELNIVGSGVSITKVNGLPTVTITGGSGATAVETPTGDVDGVNVTYTVANDPLYIIVDGISKFETLHYTYLAGTITITDGAIPTQYIRSVFSA